MSLPWHLILLADRPHECLLLKFQLYLFIVPQTSYIYLYIYPPSTFYKVLGCPVLCMGPQTSLEMKVKQL